MFGAHLTPKMTAVLCVIYISGSQTTLYGAHRICVRNAQSGAGKNYGNAPKLNYQLKIFPYIFTHLTESIKNSYQ